MAVFRGFYNVFKYATMALVLCFSCTTAFATGVNGLSWATVTGSAYSNYNSCPSGWYKPESVNDCYICPRGYSCKKGVIQKNGIAQKIGSGTLQNLLANSLPSKFQTAFSYWINKYSTSNVYFISYGESNGNLISGDTPPMSSIRIAATGYAAWRLENLLTNADTNGDSFQSSGSGIGWGLQTPVEIILYPVGNSGLGMYTLTNSCATCSTINMNNCNPSTDYFCVCDLQCNAQLVATKSNYSWKENACIATTDSPSNTCEASSYVNLANQTLNGLQIGSTGVSLKSSPADISTNFGTWAVPGAITRSSNIADFGRFAYYDANNSANTVAPFANRTVNQTTWVQLGWTVRDSLGYFYGAYTPGTSVTAFSDKLVWYNDEDFGGHITYSPKWCRPCAHAGQNGLSCTVTLDANGDCSYTTTCSGSLPVVENNGTPDAKCRNYKVTYLCGSTSTTSTTPTDSNSYPNNTNVQVQTNTCTNANATFAGWKCGNQTVAAGGSFTIHSDTICIAQWNCDENNGYYKVTSPLNNVNMSLEVPDVTLDTFDETNMTWSDVFSYGTVSGIARCSNTSGTRGQTGNPTATGGKHCWCKVTGYTPTNGSQQSISFLPWVYLWAACDSSGNSVECAYQCQKYTTIGGDAYSAPDAYADAVLWHTPLYTGEICEKREIDLNYSCDPGYGINSQNTNLLTSDPSNCPNVSDCLSYKCSTAVNDEEISINQNAVWETTNDGGAFSVRASKIAPANAFTFNGLIVKKYLALKYDGSLLDAIDPNTNLFDNNGNFLSQYSDLTDSSNAPVTITPIFCANSNITGMNYATAATVSYTINTGTDNGECDDGAVYEYNQDATNEPDSTNYLRSLRECSGQGPDDGYGYCEYSCPLNQHIIQDEWINYNLSNYYCVPYFGITYTMNGGTEYSGQPTYYDQGVGVIIGAGNAVPTKANHVFNGWTGSNGNTPQKSFSVGTDANDTGAKSYTANWTECACTAGTGVASCGLANPSVTNNLCQYTYTCASGYSHNGNNSGTFSDAGAVTFDCTAKCNAITMDNQTNNGSSTNTTLYKLTGDTRWFSDSSCTQGNTISQITAPTKTNATFTGYFTASDNTTTSVASGADPSVLSTSWTVNSNTTVYAQWTCNSGYRLEGTDCVENIITATVSDNTKEYTGTALNCNGSITGLNPSDATVGYAKKTGNSCDDISPSSYGAAPSITNVNESTTICYRITKNNYQTKTSEFNCTITPAPITASASDITLTYNGTTTSDGTAQSCANVTVTSPSGAEIKYSESENGTYETTVPTLTNTTEGNNGTKTIWYKVSKTNYETTDAVSYTCTMNAATPTYTKSDQSWTYDGNSHNCAGVTLTKPTDGTVLYSTNNIDYSSDVPAVTNVVDTKPIYFKVRGTNFSESQVDTFNCTIARATMNPNPDLSGNTKEYDGTALNCNGGTQTNVPSGSDIKYRTTGSTYTTTVPTITNPGTTTVYYQVTNGNYNSYEGTFDCIVTKKSCQVTLKDSANGNDVTSNSVTYPTSWDYFYAESSNNGIDLTVTSDNANFTPNFNTTSGHDYSGQVSVSIHGAGTATITVTSPANTFYSECSATYTLTAADKTIEFDTNGGSGTCNSLTCSYGSSQNCVTPTGTENSCQISNGSLGLSKWNTASDGTGTDVALGGNAANVTGPLYAQWAATYYINYSCNNGTNNSQSDGPYASGRSVILASGNICAAPSNTGKVFNGWDDCANPVTIGNSDITCTARWACPAGKYWNTNTCTLCPAGTYKSSVGDEACTACPADSQNPARTVTSETGRTSITQCYVDCTTTIIEHATKVSTDPAYYSTENNAYPTCSYKVTCESGYYAMDDDSPNARCVAADSEVTLVDADKNTLAVVSVAQNQDMPAATDENGDALKIPINDEYGVFIGFFDENETKYYNHDLSSAKKWDKTGNGHILYATYAKCTCTPATNVGECEFEKVNEYNQCVYTYICKDGTKSQFEGAVGVGENRSPACGSADITITHGKGIDICLKSENSNNECAKEDTYGWTVVEDDKRYFTKSFSPEEEIDLSDVILVGSYEDDVYSGIKYTLENTGLDDGSLNGSVFTVGSEDNTIYVSPNACNDPNLYYDIETGCTPCPLGSHINAGATGCVACDPGLPNDHAEWTGNPDNCSWACKTGYTLDNNTCIPVETSITLEDHDGSGGNGTIYTIYNTGVYTDAAHTTAMTTSANPVNRPKNDGYTFSGYYSTQSGNGTQYIDADGKITSDGLLAAKGYTTNQTWHARYTECTACSVTNASGCVIHTDNDNQCTYTATCDTGYSTNGGTDTGTSANCTGNSCSCSAKCNAITMDNQTNNSSGTNTTLYKFTGDTAWYSNNTCTTQVSNGQVTAPTKTNATFTGYFTASDNTTTSVATGANPSELSTTWTITSDTTVYAHWDCNTHYQQSGTDISGACTNNIYTITLRNYDNSATHETIYEKYADGFYSNDTATTGITAASVPSRTGYTFRGYYTETQSDLTATGGSGTRKITDASANNLPVNTEFTANTSLYAAWAQDCTQPANGTCSLTVNNDGTVTYTASCDTGYTVVNGNTSTPTCNTNVNSITLNANGATGGTINNTEINGSSQTTAIECSTGASTDLPEWASEASSNTTNITKGNSIFLGWSTNSSCTNSSCAVTQITCPANNTTIYYAVWSDCTECSDASTTTNTANCSLRVENNICNYTTSCKAGYGTLTGEGTSAPSCTQCSAGTSSPDINNTCDVCEAGYYSGAGASSCSECTTGYTNSGNTAADHANASSCKATVTLNKNGGSGTIKETSGDTNATIECSQGTSCDFGSTSTLTLAGYEFSGGWGTSTDCSDDDTSFTNPTGTYYACKSANSIELSWFDDDGPTPAEQTTCDYGSGIDIPQQPTKEGYVFKGWVVRPNAEP